MAQRRAVMALLWGLAGSGCSGCQEAEPTEEPPPPTKPATLVAYAEVVEENSDNAPGRFPIDGEGATGPAAWVTEKRLVVRAEVFQKGELSSLQVQAPVPPKDQVALVVFFERRYLGKGRIGAAGRWYFVADRANLAPPSPPASEQTIGLDQSPTGALAASRAWPGELALSRAGDGLDVLVGGQSLNLAPGKEHAMTPWSAKIRLKIGTIRPGSQPDTAVEEIRDAGEVEFTTRVTVRHHGIRELEVLQ